MDKIQKHVLMQYHCPNTPRLIHNTDNWTVTVTMHRLDWLLCHASHESPCASQKKLHCPRAYHFASPQYTATSEFTHRGLCSNCTLRWQSINVCKLAGKSQSTLRQTAISRCKHTGVCLCVRCLTVPCWTAALRNHDTISVQSHSRPACVNYYSFHDATAPSGPGPPHCLAFTTLRTTTLGRTPLDKWSALRRDVYLTTHNIHKRQTSKPPSEIQSHNSGKRTATDPHFRHVWISL